MRVKNSALIVLKSHQKYSSVCVHEKSIEYLGGKQDEFFLITVY